MGNAGLTTSKHGYTIPTLVDMGNPGLDNRESVGAGRQKVEGKGGEGRTDMQQKYVWAAVAIAAMWLAILFVGVFGGDFRTESMHDTTEIPIVLMVAPFAMSGTVLVAIFGFRK